MTTPALNSSPGDDVRPSLQDPSLFINRELSWLAFNERVPALAWDEGHPLLERVTRIRHPAAVR
jgi:polyphosphate kinase